MIAPDPRRPGGRYWCAYWQQVYTVRAMWSTVAGRVVWLRVYWPADQRETVHCTPFDARPGKDAELGPAEVTG